MTRLYDIIDRNFPQLAASLGARAVIARGTQPAAFSSDVAQKYLGKDHDELFRLIPALLITNAHPNELTEESLRLVVPLRDAEDRFQSWPHFFKELSDFVQGKNDEFLERFQDEESVMDVANRVVTLNPTVFGCGINLKAFRIGPGPCGHRDAMDRCAAHVPPIDECPSNVEGPGTLRAY
jgi:hypothetical protein